VNPPIYIFLNTPADLDAFWKRWTQPDFVLQKGADYSKLLTEAARGAGPRSGDSLRASIDGLAARGEVIGELAHLSLELAIAVLGKEPVWLPIRLDDLTVTNAREAGRDLPLRNTEGRWEIAVQGAGAHTVRIDLLAPVKPTSDGRRIEIPIPRVASTRIELDVPQEVADSVAGGRDLVAIEPIEAGQRTRLSANLSPRTSLELAWRLAAPPGKEPAPLLEARGEIALEIDAASVRTRATFEVSSSRGNAPRLVFTIGPEESLQAVELDDELLAVESRGGTVSIPLAEPLRPGAARRVLLVTQRKLAGVDGPRWVFGGFPLANAASQTGIVAVGQSANLWIDGEPGRALRQIDLRELPAELRGRPTTAQAFQFLDQPFQLALTAQPSPPHVRVDTQSTVMVERGVAKLDCWLGYQVTRAGVFELEVGLPRGLDLDSAGPEGVVESYHWIPERPGATLPDLAQTFRVLTLRLTARARDDGSFRIHLTGHQAIDPSGRVELALFQPRGALGAGGRIAVLTARNVSVDLPEASVAGGASADFSSAGLAPPADWPWPADRPVATSSPTPALWLRHDGNTAVLPLQATVQPRTVHHETTIQASVERRRIDVLQETVCHVHYGTLTRLDIGIPPAIDGLWDLDGDEVATTERLKIDPDGQHRYRLTLRQEVNDSVRLKFRYRLPLEPALAPNRPTTLSIPWLSVLEGSASGPKLEVSADPGIQLEPAARGWMRAANPTPAEPSGLGEAGGFTLIRTQGSAAPATLLATARALASLPALVASRLWLRSILGPEGRLRTIAWYRLEIHDRWLSIALPGGAQWVRAIVGGNPLSEMERLSGGEYRLHLPPGTPAGPVVVGLEFTMPAAGAEALRLAPPRLLDDALVQETYWEVAVPWHQLAVESPGRWIDENEWFWDEYALKRRPWKSAEALTSWVAGPSAHLRLAEELESSPRGGYHSYLYHCEGSPQPLRLPLVSRGWLVAICSGVVLALGFLILLWRPAGLLPSLAVAGFLLAVAAAERPNLAILVVQSSLAGLALVLLAGLVQRVIETRRRRRPLFTEPSSLTPSAVPGSSLKRAASAGSDDSTAIRIRPGSTQEHPSSQPPPNPGTLLAEGSKLER
jgi:hypothetical protein